MNLFRCAGRGWKRLAVAAVFGGAAVIGCVGQAPSVAQEPPARQQPLVKMGAIPAAARFDAAGHLDAERATRAYLDTVPADKRAASDKYFEGGYWLLFWDAVYTIAVMLLLLFTGASVRIRDVAARLTRFRWLQAWVYFAEFSAATTVLTAPLSYYAGFYREHLYNQSHQAFGGWLRDQAVGGGVGLVFGGIVVASLYAAVRRVPDSWHVWGSVMVIGFLVVSIMIGPVYIAPLFNTYTPLNDPEVTAPVLRMARANGIPVEKLYEVDASRQTTQVSANVSGMFGTTQIRLNDNLLREASLEEIEDVTGHEMGHYVLNHIVKSVCQFSLLIVAVFAVARVWLTSMQRRWGARWGTEGVADVALFPAAVLAFTVIGLMTTPVTNTIVRTQEYEADMYGLNAARQPDGAAQIDLKLGQYRKLEPGPVEEFLFFDHPSGYVRIRAAMRWKSENARTVRDCAGY